MKHRSDGKDPRSERHSRGHVQVGKAIIGEVEGFVIRVNTLSSVEPGGCTQIDRDLLARLERMAYAAFKVRALDLVHIVVDGDRRAERRVPGGFTINLDRVDVL